VEEVKMAELHPAAREIILAIGKIGYRSIAAAVSTGLKGLSELTEEVDRRVKRGERAAAKMAEGKPYEPED
jgi:hypothetical protein